MNFLANKSNDYDYTTCGHTMRFWRIGSENRVCLKIQIKTEVARGEPNISNLQLGDHFGTGPQQNMALGKAQTA